MYRAQVSKYIHPEKVRRIYLIGVHQGCQLRIQEQLENGKCRLVEPRTGILQTFKCERKVPP